MIPASTRLLISAGQRQRRRAPVLVASKTSTHKVRCCCSSRAGAGRTSAQTLAPGAQRKWGIAGRVGMWGHAASAHRRFGSAARPDSCRFGPLHRWRRPDLDHATSHASPPGGCGHLGGGNVACHGPDDPFLRHRCGTDRLRHGRRRACAGLPRLVGEPPGIKLGGPVVPELLAGAGRPAHGRALRPHRHRPLGAPPRAGRHLA
jgi:hypothetical protein